MKRLLLVALVVALLVVQPATAASYPSAEAACGQTEGSEVLIGIFPGASELQSDSQVETGETRVYSGTEFRVALCKNGELKQTRGPEWSLESSPGLNVTEETDSTVTVRVTGETNRIEVPELVSGKQNLQGISLSVHRAPRGDSALVEEQITFQNASTAATYNETEQAYLSALADLSSASEQLNDSADTLRSGEVNAGTVSTDVLASLNQSRTEVNSTGEDVKKQLYQTAWRSDDETTVPEALSAVETRKTAATTDAENAMGNYLMALKAAERNAQSTILFNLGGAAILGLVIGAIPGWWLTEQKLEDVRFDQEVNSSVSYGPRLLARAVGLAVVALLVTLAVLTALGGLSTIEGLL